MIDIDKIEEAFEFKEIKDILRLEYNNNLNNMFCNYNWLTVFDREYFFKILWYYRENKKLNWIKIINSGQFIWSLNDFYRFREYFNWNDMTYQILAGSFEQTEVSIYTFLKVFEKYINWHLINRLIGVDNLQKFKQAFMIEVQ